MSDIELPHFSPEDFGGIARIFPLPNLVLFPHVVQALHIFEPRYCEMLQDALAGDRLIALGLLAPGWEKDYEGRPPIHDTVCLGRVITQSSNKDGTRNILLVGLCRGRIQYELPTSRSFRQASLELLVESAPENGVSSSDQMRQELLNLFRDMLPHDLATREQMEQLFGTQVPLGVLTDLVAYSLKTSIAFKQSLLEEVDVERRARRLIARLNEGLDSNSSSELQGFPPEFSLN